MFKQDVYKLQEFTFIYLPEFSCMADLGVIDPTVRKSMQHIVHDIKDIIKSYTKIT